MASGRVGLGGSPVGRGHRLRFREQGHKELRLGGVIVCPPKSQITLTASVLGRALFRGMAIRVGSLAGFLTARERQCLETDVARQCAPFPGAAAGSRPGRADDAVVRAAGGAGVVGPAGLHPGLRGIGRAAVVRGDEHGADKVTRTSRRPKGGCRSLSARFRNPSCPACPWANWPKNCTAANATPAACFARSGEPASRPMWRKFASRRPVNCSCRRT